jgi:2-C-methyl-D-erythritol 2,4-cyclodiphosphate synthase
LENDNAVYTDDSSVFARYCGAPTLCEGSPANIKLTYAPDFEKAFARCGFGVATHAFGKAQDYIVLAGVKIPSQSGLIAHSDGDVAIHALMDALLSAAGLKDIGFYFPDSSPKWKDANSMDMLKQVLLLLDERGYQTQNVSIAVQAEKPRLAKYIDEMKIRLANALRIDPTAVGITAGTNEGLGYVGEGKGITVNAYVLLQRK